MRSMRIILRSVFRIFLLITIGVWGLQLSAGQLVVHAQGTATLFLTPSVGSFVTGSTFTLSLYLNTAGQNSNAVDVQLVFPPDKLQVVSPTSGHSFVEIWITPPSFDNQRGTLSFQGAIPTPGINTSQGLVAQITFRAVGLGQAYVRFDDASRILLNDGKGTNILGDLSGAVLSLALPPPGGPIVSSPSHPDQESWYSKQNVEFRWTSDVDVEGFSYALNASPIDIPDNIPDGSSLRHMYEHLQDGTYYFHVKALQGGIWGGTSHYAVNIDTTPPADFPIELIPRARMTISSPIIRFLTTDALSGLDHYELRIIPLAKRSEGSVEPFFIEATSPYNTELKQGSYDVVVRAYDHAGNFIQKTTRLEIVPQIFGIMSGEGVYIKNSLLVSWSLLWFTLLVFTTLFGGLGIIAWHRHRRVHQDYQTQRLPEHLHQKQKDAHALRSKYGKKLIVLFLCAILGMGALLSITSAYAQSAAEGMIPPPAITLFPDYVSNDELFYAGGRAAIPEAKVVLYIQDALGGGTRTFTVPVDEAGNWFHAHDMLLRGGQYIVWSQLRVGEAFSPPSPQLRLHVIEAVVELGATRVLKEVVYLGFVIILLLMLAAAIVFWAYHERAAQRKRSVVRVRIQKAVEEIEHDLHAIAKDIKTEIATMHKMKSVRALSAEEIRLEARLRADLDMIRIHIKVDIEGVEEEIL